MKNIINTNVSLEQTKTENDNIFVTYRLSSNFQFNTKQIVTINECTHAVFEYNMYIYVCIFNKFGK